MPTPDRLVYVYLLRDPRSGCIRYVGATIRPEGRVASHLAEGRTGIHLRGNEKARWMRELLAMDLAPLLEIIDVAWSWQAPAAEAKWIRHFLERGHSLVNSRPRATARGRWA